MNASLDPAQFSDLVVDGRPPRKFDGDHRTVATTESTSALVDEIVHDLRQPAACIQALVASLRAQPAGNGTHAWHLDRIEEQAIVLLATVASMLEGDCTEDQVTDLAECVGDAVASIRLTNACDLVVRAPERLLVAGSPTDLRRALVNVLDNACRAAGPTGRVALTIEQSAQATRVVVEDDGPGFGCGRDPAPDRSERCGAGCPEGRRVPGHRSLSLTRWRAGVPGDEAAHRRPFRQRGRAAPCVYFCVTTTSCSCRRSPMRSPRPGTTFSTPSQIQLPPCGLRPKPGRTSASWTCPSLTVTA